MAKISSYRVKTCCAPPSEWLKLFLPPLFVGVKLHVPPPSRFIAPPLPVLWSLSYCHWLIRTANGRSNCHRHKKRQMIFQSPTVPIGHSRLYSTWVYLWNGPFLDLYSERGRLLHVCDSLSERRVKQTLLIRLGK